jgi:two-component system sensor histidine kinase AtoS
MGRLHFNSIKKTEAEIPLAALQKLAADKGSQFWYFLAEVFDTLHQGVIVADQSGLVVIFNKRAEQIMGYSAAEVLGRSSLWDFCEECDRPPLFRESLSNGQSFPEEEVEMSGRNGTIGVRVTALYGPDGRLEGALATLRSLDEVRQREKEQKNLVRLAAIGRIISAVAHEINNPLQTVRTSLELALDPRKSTERRRDYLQAADQEISRISRIIGQMRSFYRPTPGEKQATVVNAKLQEAITLLEKPLGEAGVQVEFDLAEHLPEVNLIDYQLEQVFLNLILNALEEMPENSKLYISSRLEETDRIAISFRYKAPQSGRVELDHLFDPLANRRSHALGIGLSVCREIISELGGTIEATTNGGLTLTVYLPL